MNAYVAEVVGTCLLVLFGNGVVANVVLRKTTGHGGGWIVITAGWGMAVFVGAFSSQKYSGAHLNPAVTIANAVAGTQTVFEAGGYMLAQMVGAILGALIVYAFYREHFQITEDLDAKLACFCTAPAIRRNGQAFLCEFIGTFALVLPIFLMVDPEIQGLAATSDVTIGLGSIGLLPVALLVFAIGMSLGGTTGYAINPARDLGPRIVHFLLPMSEKRDSDWGYAWVPVLGPLAGGAAAAIVHRLLVAG